VRDVFMGWLEAKRPDLVGRYQELYRGRAYAPQKERERLASLVRRGRGRRALRFDDLPARGAEEETPATAGGASGAPNAGAGGAQERLF
jgi:hypothetical protein